jgi:hypothetical protein
VKADMPTVSIQRSDVSSSDVAEKLRTNLGAGYTVLPGKRTVRRPLAKPAAGTADTIFVGKGNSRLFTAHVTIVRRPTGTDFQISPGGLGWETIVNSMGIAKRIGRVLAAY